MTDTPMAQILDWTIREWYNENLNAEQVETLLAIISDNTDVDTQTHIQFLKRVIL